MTRITPEDEKRIADAIRAAESKTAGEIFCVMTHASSDYRLVPVAWAAAIALFVPWPLIYFTDLAAWTIYVIELSAFLAATIVFSLPGMRFRIVPQRVKRERAHWEAQRQFAAQGLHRTSARTGALIFVSVAERYVEIVEDMGIADNVSTHVCARAVA